MIISLSKASSPVIFKYNNHPDTFNEVGRSAIRSDPGWNRREYYESSPPVSCLSLVRMIGHITNLLDDSMYNKSGRGLQEKEEIGYDFSTDFQGESYLHYQGDQLVKRMDHHHISALPVLDEERRVIGLITTERLSRLVSRCR